MPFPLSLNGEIEFNSVIEGNVKPENIRDIIASSLRELQGCSVRTDDSKILFSCSWGTISRRGWSILARFSRGEISLSAKETSLVVSYNLSILQEFVFDVVIGGLLILAISHNSFIPIPVGLPSLGLWCLLFIGDYFVIAMRFRRFLKRCVREMSKRGNNS